MRSHRFEGDVKLKEPDQVCSGALGAGGTVSEGHRVKRWLLRPTRRGRRSPASFQKLKVLSRPA